MPEIVCTIGPVSCDGPTFIEMARAGMTMARFNLSHNVLEWHRTAMQEARGAGIPVYVDIPGRKPRPWSTHRDDEAVAFALECGAEWFGFSYAETSEEVAEFKRVVPKTVAKIETELGLRNVYEIAGVADALLLDRTDMAASIGYWRLPEAQRLTILRGKARGKPVYVASDILHSMIYAPEPSAAEVMDAWSAIEQGATGLVLAGETAIGRYPVKAVWTLSAILATATQRREV